MILPIDSSELAEILATCAIALLSEHGVACFFKLSKSLDALHSRCNHRIHTNATTLKPALNNALFEQ